jgi:AbrB family looped-hinge helix DNA binding protein
MLESTITRKGQVTIPKAIRDRLGVEEGEKVLFICEARKWS